MPYCPYCQADVEVYIKNNNKICKYCKKGIGKVYTIENE